jgi:hypothetical protein
MWAMSQQHLLPTKAFVHLIAEGRKMKQEDGDQKNIGLHTVQCA